MQKLQDDDKLDLPIHIFLFKRQMIWIILGFLCGSLALLGYVFSHFSMMLNQGSYFKLLGAIIISGLWIFFSIELVSTCFSNKPIAKLDTDTLTIFPLNRMKSPINIQWQDVSKVDGFSHQHGNGVVLYLKNRPPFQDTVTLSLHGGAVIEGQILNTREVECLFNQFLAHAQKNIVSNSQPIIIRYQQVKKQFLDWY